MRKTLLLIALMTACSFVNAQTVDAVSKGETECEIVIEPGSSHKGDYRYYQPFEFSVNLGYTTAGILYPDTHVSTGNGIGWNAGFRAQFNKNAWGLRTGLSYELNKSFVIDQINPFGSDFSFRQSVVNIPVTFMYHGNRQEAFGFYCGAGFNMRYSFDSSLQTLDYKTNNLQWYGHGVFGFRLANIYIEEESSTQINNLFKTGTGVPKANLTTVSLKIGWILPLDFGKKRHKKLRL